MVEVHTQRKLAAILAADVVGYSRLMGEDEVATLAELKVCRKIIDPLITSHGGRVFGSAGDSLIAEFASPVEAVRCATKAQLMIDEHNVGIAEDRRIRFRIGINIGDVIVDGENLMGDGVNIAARLEALAEPSGIVISGDAFRQIKNKIDLAFEDLGERELKNIAEPVRVHRLKANLNANEPEHTDELFVRPALAVLPLVNMSDSSEQEYIADGLTEDIITALSYWRSFPVIARNSTFAYKGQAVDVRTVAKELGARYVLEGSVRMSAEHIRITAQLIDAATGGHVWAERIDREIKDIFELQDEIAQKIAATVAPELERAERKRVTSRTTQLNAWELHQRGMAFFNKHTKKGNGTARQYFRQAIDADPNYSTAHASLAFSYHAEISFWQATNRDEVLQMSLAAAQQAVDLDESNSYAHTVLGTVYLRMGEHELGLACCKRAIILNPSNALAHAILGNALSFAGQPMEGIDSIKKALSLNPQDPYAHYYINMIARSHLTAHDHDRAVEYARESISRHSDHAFAYLVLASALGHLGKTEAARVALEDCERTDPGRISKESKILPIVFRHTEDANHILDGLRKAGWKG